MSVLVEMEQAGLKSETISENLVPAGCDFVDHKYVEAYQAVYHPEAVVVHNNWVGGHEEKVRRLQNYHLWDVGGLPFPDSRER